jgi:hypothetical protein
MNKHRTGLALLFFAPASMIASSALAQLGGDDVPRERIVPRREQVRRDLEEARLRLGPFRVKPLFELRDVGYDNNVFGTENDAISDWRAAVSAGTDFILPVGRKNYLSGKIAPEYTWYSKLASRRSLGGTYGASWLGLYNRVSVEAGANKRKSTQAVSSEVERAARGSRTSAFVRTEVDIFRRLSLFGSADQERSRFDEIEGEGTRGLEQLEYNESAIRGGVRYRLRSYSDVTIAAEKGRTEFVTSTDRDNNTGAVIIGLHYDLPRIFVNLSAARRESKASRAGSRFPQFSSTTGSYYVEYQMGAPPQIDVYGHRSIVYSLAVESPYFSETRNGIGITVPVGQRLGIRVLSEFGTNDYPVAERGTAVKRADDVITLGGGLALRLRRNTYVSVVASETRYESNLDFDRSIFRVSTVISLRGQPFR